MSGKRISMPGNGVAIYTVFVLFIANVFNLVDRSILGVLLEEVRVDLGLSDTQMSVVSGLAFALVHLAAGILVSRWVDYRSRKWILAVGVMVWSLATVATGLSTSFATLFLARMMTGIGEAAVFPVAMSMIADLFDVNRRPKAVSAFHLSNGVGIILGTVLAGIMAAAFGWRYVFIIFGSLGAIPLLLALTLREPVRGAQDRSRVSGTAENLHQALATVWRLPGFGFLVTGFGFASMAFAVLPIWVPTFLARSHQVDIADLGLVLAPPVGLGGVLGIVISGVVASRLVERSGRAVDGLKVPLIALPIAPLFFLLFLASPTLVPALVALGLGNFFLSAAMGPSLAYAISLTPTGVRAVGANLMLVSQGLLGGTLGPLVVGMVSDGLGASLGVESLRYALGVLVIAPIIAPCLLWLAFKANRRGFAKPDSQDELISLGKSLP
ncbi:MFS transporter [Aurantiacibacter gilvus]|uniref:MFS transporter n=1 Tax=Aurantiacibacter gilvus TaxID=3139141 RepID=A0ABU9IGW3_9SPHN